MLYLLHFIPSLLKSYYSNFLLKCLKRYLLLIIFLSSEPLTQEPLINESWEPNQRTIIFINDLVRLVHVLDITNNIESVQFNSQFMCFLGKLFLLNCHLWGKVSLAGISKRRNHNLIRNLPLSPHVTLISILNGVWKVRHSTRHIQKKFT